MPSYFSLVRSLLSSTQPDLLNTLKPLTSEEAKSVRTLSCSTSIERSRRIGAEDVSAMIWLLTDPRSNPWSTIVFIFALNSVTGLVPMASGVYESCEENASISPRNSAPPSGLGFSS